MEVGDLFNIGGDKDEEAVLIVGVIILKNYTLILG